MTNIIWKKNYSSSNDGERLAAYRWADFQRRVAGAVNGGLTKDNISSSAAIVESKVSFNTTTGHNHDGTNSRLISSLNPTIANDPHIRSGLHIKKVDADTIRVRPGYIALGNALMETTADNDLTVSDSDNYITGSETASTFIYVYMGNTGSAASPVVDIKLSSTDAPNIGNKDDGTAERPLRYRKFSSVLYRCLGGFFNDSNSDITDDRVTSFDLLPYYQQYLDNDGNDTVFTTIWTPQLIYAYEVPADSTSGNKADIALKGATEVTLNSSVGFEFSRADFGYLTASSDAGMVETITDQAAGTPGSFQVNQPDNTAPATNDFHTIIEAYFIGEWGS